MSEWDDEVSRMVEDCERRCERMSDWETTFIDSISYQLAHGKHLTSKQYEVLERVWEKVTAR